jgi:hypothetical protein
MIGLEDRTPAEEPSEDPSATRERDRLIYRLKLQHVALVLLPLALLLYAYEDRLMAWRRLPYRSVADTLLTTTIVVLAFEWFLRRETELRLSRIVADTVHRQLGPLARSFFTEPQVLLRALNEQALDQVISTALGIILKDKDLAAEVDTRLLRSIARYEERWTNARFTVTLTRIQDHESPTIRDQYFQAYVGLRFETILRRTSFPVWCVRSKQAYDDIMWNDRSVFYPWLQPRTPEFPTVGEESFAVESISVNGIQSVNSIQVATCTVEQKDGQRMLITCHDEELRKLKDQPVIVEATFRVMIPKRAHSINLTVPVPTRGVVMALNYGGTEVRRVEVVDMFVAGHRPDIRALPTTSRPRSVEVELREWVLPRGGVVFHWRLDQEQTTEFNSLLADPDHYLD